MDVYGWFLSERIPCVNHGLGLFSDYFQRRPPHSNPSQVLHLDRWCAIASPPRSLRAWCNANLALFQALHLDQVDMENGLKMVPSLS